MDLSAAKAEMIGHLGLIAATLQDFAVMQKVDGQFGKVEGSLNYGCRVGAMVLNGLVFVSTALYMMPRFFFMING